MYRPRALINIFILSPNEDKILIIKQNNNTYWNCLGDTLSFGEEFKECAERILLEKANFKVDNIERIEFVCTYNALAKAKILHFVSVVFRLKCREEEYAQSFRFEDNETISEYKWVTFDELKKEELFFVNEIFFSQYKISSFQDIKNINSN